MTWNRERGSFRDPSGFVFACDGVVYRQVNAGFGASYRQLKTSGLYDDLRRDRLLVAHEELTLPLPGAPPADVILRPEQVPFISYPYEWCFGQLKAAALLTLEIQRRALARGMTLRDASAFNVQFLGTQPIFIDTLSFGEYVEGRPWAAYRQFCQHFLGPLALRAYAHGSLGDLTRVHLDGIPLDLVARLLPYASRFRPGLLLHLHLHGRSAVAASNGQPAGSQQAGAKMSRTAMLGLVDSLDRTVRRLSWTPPATLWSTYAPERSVASGRGRPHRQRTAFRHSSARRRAARHLPRRARWIREAGRADGALRPRSRPFRRGARIAGVRGAPGQPEQLRPDVPLAGVHPEPELPGRDRQDHAWQRGPARARVPHSAQRAHDARQARRLPRLGHRVELFRHHAARECRRLLL